MVPTGYDSLTTADGRTRTYRVVDLATTNDAPLLFVLHGFAGDAEGMRTTTAVEESLVASLPGGAVVVYPNGSGLEQGLPQSWNAGDCCPFAIFEPVDDVSFFDQLIEELSAKYSIDQARVWVLGYSNGGMMAYRLACELSARISAIGVAAGALMVNECSPARTVSMLHVHGDIDEVVPRSGGNVAGIAFPSVEDSLARFAIANGCQLDGEVICTDAQRPTTIRLVTDPAWGHAWQAEWTPLFREFFASLLQSP